MTTQPRLVFSALLVCALLSFTASTAYCGTIIKLTLGGVGPDVAMDNLGVLSTVDIGSPGDQPTSIDFTSFLEPLTDIPTNVASFSLRGLTKVGVPQIYSPLVIQNFQNGTFELYGPAPDNTLLLSAALSNSALSGVIGPPGTGALFTTTYSTVTGGSLQPYLVGNSIAISMNMTNVNGGNGFGTDVGPVLLPFLADASVDISANPSDVPVPEPASAMLAVAISAVAAVFVRRYRR